MKRFRTLLLLSGLVLCSVSTPSASFAQDKNPANWCRWSAEAKLDRFATATVNAGGKVYFVGDDKDCPAAKLACQKKAYLIAGDAVLTGHAFGSWTCAYYQPAKGNPVEGWLPTSRLKTSAVSKNAVDADWIGKWVSNRTKSPSYFEIAKAKPLQISSSILGGEGVADGGLQEPIAVNADGNKLAFKTDDAKFTLRLLGQFLVVWEDEGSDPSRTNSTGVYSRAH